MSKTKIVLHIKSKIVKKKQNKSLMSIYGPFVVILCILGINYLRSVGHEVTLVIHPRYKQARRNVTSAPRTNHYTFSQPMTSPHTSATARNMATEKLFTKSVRKLTHGGRTKPKTLKGFKSHNVIVSIAEPTVRRKSQNPIGAWMKDQQRNDDMIYVMEDFVKNNQVQIFTDFENETTFDRHFLPYYWGGTGHVVMDGNLYFSKYNTNKVVKYNFEQRKVLLEEEIPGAGFANMCPYQWAGSTDLDLTADAGGLWVIYATEANDWNISIGRLDDNSLKVMRVWNTTYTKRWAGNAFIAGGILYAVKRYDSYSTSLNFAFDTKTNSVLRPNVTMTIKNQFLTQLDYNQRERRLYAWDKGDLITYDVNFT